MSTYKELHTLLTEVGVSPSAQQTYLDCLDQGTKTSKDIAFLTQQPKPTVMTNLQQLVRFGLCKKTPQDNKSFFYTMLSPAHLKPFIARQITDLNQTLDGLDSFSTKETSLTTHEAHGQTEVQHFLELALRCKKRDWWIASPYKNAVRYMPQTYQEYFKKTREDRQIKSMSIWNKHIAKRGLRLHDQLMRKPRFVPDDHEGSIGVMMIVFDSYTLIVEGKEKPSAILIESAPIAETFKLLFEIAWVSLRKGSSSAS